MALLAHTFVGVGPYCEHWNTGSPQGDPATTGTITMSVQCGYPPESHITIPASIVSQISDNGDRFGSGDIPGTPCQPIGCDNGYHLPGCVYGGQDADMG